MLIWVRFFFPRKNSYLIRCIQSLWWLGFGVILELANVDVNLNQLDENMLALNNDPSNFIVSELCNVSGKFSFEFQFRTIFWRTCLMSRELLYFQNDLADSINEPVNETVVETLQTDTNDKNLSSELLSIDSLECWFDNIPVRIRIGNLKETVSMNKMCILLFSRTVSQFWSRKRILCRFRRI